VNDLQEYLVREFVADYRDGLLSRRDMVRRVVYITGGVASAATLLTSLGCGPSAAPSATVAPKPPEAAKPTTAAAAASPSPAAAASPSPLASPAAVPSPPTVAAPSPSPSPSPAAGGSPLSVAANDPAIEVAEITFPGEGVTIQAYQARPRGTQPVPLVLVCHENRGITDHIRDVARRFAKEGYVACAVDLLSREGGTARVADPAQVPALLSGAPPERHVSDFQAALEHYKRQSGVQPGAYAMTGFCFGGGIVWRSATRLAELKAAAPYYGPRPPLPDVPGIKAAMLGVYSSDPQDFANEGRGDLEAALKQAGVTYEFKIYPNTQHAFNNDTGPRFNQEQSLAAWRDTLAWFSQHVRT
jgi:carboxymethylenebutenolidase